MTTPRMYKLQRGTRVGAYVVGEAIGLGTAQVAYLAESPDGRKVVLKMSLFPMGQKGSSDRKMHDRFMRQVTYFGQLSDAVAVPQMFGAGMFPDASESGYAYLVQEWIPGGLNIVEWAQEEPHELKTLVAGWILLAKACEKMTCRGICHRDLKPQSILVRPDGIPKIVDFNSGRRVGVEPLTADGRRPWPGMTRYYAPEVCWALLKDYTALYRMSFAELATADLHGLGVIFYQVLTGVYPFDKDACELDLLEQIACELPDPPRSLNPVVPAGLDEVTMKLLRKDPKKRYQFGDEVAAELGALLKTGEEWTRPFQTPAKELRSAPSRSQTSRTTPSTATATDGSAFDVRTTAIGSQAERSALLPQPKPRPPLPHCGAILRAAVLTLTAVVTWLSLGQHGAPGSFIERGMMWLGRTKMAVAAAALMAFIACAHFMGMVRTGEKEWMVQCPPESRKAVHELGLSPDEGVAVVLPGPHVIIQPYHRGLEVQDGPVEVSASIPARDHGKVARLYGVIRTGTDGATIHFTKMRLFQEADPDHGPPSGPERDICAVGIAIDDPRDPGGIPKVGDTPPPDYKPHPGFTFVTSEMLNIVFAH